MKERKDLFHQFDFGDRVVNPFRVVGPSAFHFLDCGLDAPADAASGDFEDERLGIILDGDGDEIHGGGGGVDHGERVTQSADESKNSFAFSEKKNEENL